MDIIINIISGFFFCLIAFIVLSITSLIIGNKKEKIENNLKYVELKK